MILTVSDKKRRKKSGTLKKIIKLTIFAAILVIPIVLLYNFLFIVKTVDAPAQLKVTVDRYALGKPIFTIHKKELLKKFGDYPPFDIRMVKIIPGKLVIRKKQIEPEVYIPSENIYVDMSGNIFRVTGKKLYSHLTVKGDIQISEINHLLQISKTGLFKVIYDCNGYFYGRIGNVKVYFDDMNGELIKQMKLVMKKESRRHYAMDLRFKNQIIIRR